MIRIDSSSPTELNFICSTQEEADFCEANKEKLFDKFVEKRTKGKYKTFKSYIDFVYDDSDYSEFGVIGLKAHLARIKALNMEWNRFSIGDLQDMFNEEYERVNKKNPLRRIYDR